MPIAVKTGVIAAVSALVLGAVYLAWVRGPALILDLSSGVTALFCF